MGYRYIGSKIRVVDEIIRYLETSVGKGGRFIDAFSGTGIVASKAADYGWPVHVNDMMKSAVTISESRLLSNIDVPFVSLGGYDQALLELNSQKGISGFFYNEYSPGSLTSHGFERRYFTEVNAKKIDAVIDTIENWSKMKRISDCEKTLLLATLISAMNSIANIAGTYGCFLSKWSQQSLQDLVLHPLSLRDDRVCYTSSNVDVFDLCSKEEDVVYLDPPYTKRQYASYYHILETVAVGDSPVVNGVSGLRPWKDKSSVFCYKNKALSALVELITKQKARSVLLSYSDEGHVDIDDLLPLLSASGSVHVVELSFIGRYRPNKVASNNRSQVKEYLIDYRHR